MGDKHSLLQRTSERMQSKRTSNSVPCYKYPGLQFLFLYAEVIFLEISTEQHQENRTDSSTSLGYIVTNASAYIHRNTKFHLKSCCLLFFLLLPILPPSRAIWNPDSKQNPYKQEVLAHRQGQGAAERAQVLHTPSSPHLTPAF